MQYPIPSSGQANQSCNWYEASYTTVQKGKKGVVYAVMDILAINAAEAQSIAQQCMEPTEVLQFVTYRGTQQDYEDLYPDLAGVADWADDEKVRMTFVVEPVSISGITFETLFERD